MSARVEYNYAELNEGISAKFITLECMFSRELIMSHNSVGSSPG